MKRMAIVGFLVVAAASYWRPSPISAEGPATVAAHPTFNKDVLPILQKNCQTCHRSGEIAPFTLTSYDDVRPRARGIKNAVSAKQMPPWDAEDGYAIYSNDKRLSENEIQTLVAWVDQGAVEGDARDKPAPVQFPDGWKIKPDMIIEMPKDVKLPATGTINYQNVLVRVNFPEDRWVIAAEMRPGNRQAVHHMRANIIPQTSSYMANVEEGVAYENGDKRLGSAAGTIDLLGKFNPGLGDQVFNEFDSAKFVPKGSNIVFNLHYTSTGVETTDRSKVGLVFAPRGWSPKYRYFVHNGPLASNLAIPAYDANAEVVAELTTQVPMKLAYMQPHMHLRGKDFELRLIFPSGETRTVLKGKWDFNWQLGHDLAEPIDLPVGTRIISICHYDNSAGNKANPDPSKLVWWGDQNWDEMQNIFIGVLVDPKADQKTFFKASGPSLLKRSDSGPTLAALLLAPGSAPSTRPARPADENP
jgi:mono/diheme cytochrome c family protein